MEADEFYKLAVDRNFPDQMLFQLAVAHPKPGRTFSKGAVAGIASNFHDFVMARIFGTWERTRVPPLEMEIEVKIHWKQRNAEQSEFPFFTGDDTGGLELLDGKHRIRWNEEE